MYSGLTSDFLVLVAGMLKCLYLSCSFSLLSCGCFESLNSFPAGGASLSQTRMEQGIFVTVSIACNRDVILTDLCNMVPINA